MRSSFLTFLAIIGGFVAVANVYPLLFARELPEGQLAMLETPRPVPKTTFSNGNDESVDLTQFEGKYLLINVWATWCEPCREEMPALDRLSQSLAGANIVVMPISVDVTGTGTVERFYKRHNLRDLPVFVDPAQNIMSSLNVIGIPTTVLIDPDGREIGRMVGPARWDSPTSVQSLRDIANGSTTVPNS